MIIDLVNESFLALSNLKRIRNSRYSWNEECIFTVPLQHSYILTLLLSVVIQYKQFEPLRSLENITWVNHIGIIELIRIDDQEMVCLLEALVRHRGIR